MIMAFLGWCLFGLVVGAIARFVLPGRQSMGIIMTIILGVLGSFVGGFLGSLFEAGDPGVLQPSGWIGSIIGALLLLIGYSYLSKPKV
jgi:uncharacterized membrane protein YeaQ/YmgE (transglycosylase-associated protein family)